MATTTVSGSTVTFSNSGAAANLSTQTSEDSLLADFNISTVLGESGGGTKTTLYSIDNGVAGDNNSPVTTNKAFATYDTDLLYKDCTVAAWIDGGDTSALGAHVWIGTDGKIHYDATNIANQFQQLAAGETTTDTIKYTIKMSNGTLSVGTLNVVITGSNDAALITGSSTAALSESDAAQSTGGDLNATDVDSPATFVAQGDVAGSNGYGKFSIDAAGTWTYTMNDAHDEFVGGQDYTDSITVATADGTSQVITVTMHGRNDAAVITGTSTTALTETNTAQSTGGTLVATDPDSSNAFVVQTDVGGSNGLGKFSIDAAGHWTYTMASAYDEFVGGQDYTDSITVATADGTSQVITVTMHGTDDATVITGTSTTALTETNTAQSTGGTLVATDPDSSNAFVVQTDVGGSNGLGKFSIDAAGHWTYTMASAHDEFVGGQDYTDSITVATADGTSQVITVTMHGTDDATVITGTSTTALTETNTAQSTGGTLVATDPDSSNAFVVQTDIGGSNGLGKFSIDAAGHWTYTMASAHDEFVGGQDYTDSITVATADGTSQVITVTMHGTDDATVITGTSTTALTETNTAQSTGGTLVATDPDSSNAFVVQTDVGGSNGLGKFSIDAAGHWTYTMASAHDEFVGGQDYTDSITVATADGTSQVITVTMHGTDDATVITGTSTTALTETNTAQSTGGTLVATDPDSSNAFVVQTDVGGSNGLGKFSIDAAGHWTYTMASAHDEFVGGQDYTDSITVATADGTSQVITVTMHGTDDATVITGTSTTALTETNTAQSTGGTLVATDPDSSNAFVVQTDVGGSNGLGKFSIDAAGHWTYTMASAHDEFVGGQDYTDSITVKTADGTSQVITVTMHGTDDATVITGTSTAELTEANATQSTGGTLVATDPDSSNAFVVQTDAAGSNGYGKFSIDAAGTWTYTMNDAHDEFVGGQDYTDSITVATADGTSQVITVTMHGTDDATVITGTSTTALTETNTAQSTGGTLVATDPDSSNAFVVQTDVGGSNGLGKFSIDAAGHWTYTMASAHDEFVGGQDYTDSITVATADGTSQVITVTMHGTDDATVITGTSTTALTETNTAQSTGGTLVATDPDSSNAFVVQTDVGGSNGLGKFSIDAAGHWTYTMASAHDEFVGGQDYTDSITVATADGTSQVITVTMHGTDDATVITGTSTTALTETNTAQSTGGTLVATDPDSSNAFVVQTDVGGSNGLGKFSIDAAGHWTYTMASAHDEFVGGQDYTDSITVATADGTSQVITVTMHGTDDATVITGTSTTALTETNTAQSTGGTLVATDPDSSNAFVVQTDVGGSNGLGKFSIDAAGHWTYTMASAHDEFVGGQDYTDSITVATADGTEKVITITMHGTNDALAADSDTSNDHDADTPTGTNVQVGDGADNIISGGTGKDTLYGAGGNDTLHGDNGVDAVYGQAGNDTLYGDSGDDTLYGGSGDDVLVGGGGTDELWGGSGNDTFRFAAGDSPSNKVEIQDFHHGFDRIDVTQINSGDGGAGDFAFGGTAATAHGVWYTEGGGDTILHFDTNGSTGNDEMTIILKGTGLGLTASDFLL